MKKVIFTFLSFIIVLSTANGQKGINFHMNYAAGRKMLMNIDSSAKNIEYALGFPNQPHTYLNLLPEVNNVSIQINFRKNITIQDYRYTILVDNKPILLNKSIDMEQLKDTHAGGDEEVFRSVSFGIFPIKDKVITIITYDIKRPQEVYKNVFYGKPVPRAKVLAFSKRSKIDNGVDYNWVRDPSDRTRLTLTEKEDELTVVKEISDIDYLYYTTIIDKQSNQIIFESSVWQYGGVISKEHEPLPNISIDKRIFKKSGDYEIVIQPRIKWEISQKEKEKYITRYSLSVTLDEDNYTKKELLIYTFIVAVAIGLAFLVILYFIRKKNKRQVLDKEQQKNTARLQLNSIRSQLNPHFLFNALSGIQNLMNKNEIDNANKYLSKFARLTRNVLDNKELISLSQEKRLLDDYLQMEQLRFGFMYDINLSKHLDLDNIEIPSMLLQPFVENAVKHGISKKANAGKITITFTNRTNDLILTVTDNGNGFDTEEKKVGLGLPLSNSRIELLNSIYKENRFTLDIQSTTNGTKITLTLTDWL